MFELKNVSKQFGGAFALRGVSMDIGRGLHFIIGASGSGKTTLLKIISGMEQDFDGEVLYCGQSVKTLSERAKSDYYSSVFGFVWQDFNLLDELTVLENVMLPQYLKPQQDRRDVLKVLRELKISELAQQKAGKLSGGQKQRVAIARELLKNPQVIIADEPTSALDEKSGKTTMDILREISKTRTVIVVTHDTSLLDARAKVYELDKGELVAAAQAPPTRAAKTQPERAAKPVRKSAHRLRFCSACKLALSGMRSKWGRTTATAVTLVIAAALLLVTVSGAIVDTSQSAFQTLFDTYGDALLDVSVVGSFTSAGGTDGKQSDEPNANVEQEIDGLYEAYLQDERVTHIVFTQAYTGIEVTVDGKAHSIPQGSSVPHVNDLLAGRMPMGDGSEIVIPESFLKNLGVSAKEVLGKTADFKGSLYNWDTGEPVAMPAEISATIVGVVDTTVKYEADGEVLEYPVEDAFFFSKTALKDLRQQAGIAGGEGNFTLRAKTPADMIAVKDELNAKGIVPLGRFELVEDMVRLAGQTKQQSGSAVLVIGALAVVAVVAVATMTALTRRREYAIFKVSGYANGHLVLMAASEFLLLSAGSALLFLGTSPLLNLATTAFWEVNILGATLLGTGALLVFAMGSVACLVTAVAGTSTKAPASLKAGER